jgi:3-mercaptopropionate dioxygenase
MSLLGVGAREALVAPIAQAVEDCRVDALGEALAALCARDKVTPEMFLPPRSDRYARNLIWRCPRGTFIVVAMTWAPGQGSPLHNHAGLWGAEIVIDGEMHETVFDLAGHADDGRFRFERGMHRRSGRGTLGLIMPPKEYHNFGNAGSSVAHTLHVYSGDLTTAQTFSEDADGWWTAHQVGLRYDA